MAQQEAVKEKHARGYAWESTDERGKHKSSEQIEHEIDETRYDMDRTMNEIGSRFHPRTFVDHLLDYFRNRENREQIAHAAREVGQSTMDTVRQNPGPLLLIGGGVAWLLTSERRSHDGRHPYDIPDHYVDARTGEPYPTERETGRGADQGHKAAGPGAGEKAKDAAGSVKAGGRHAAESAAHAFARTGERAQARAHRARESAREGLASARNAAGHGVAQGAGRAGSLLRDNPLAVGLGAMALGVLAGGLAPKSRLEERLGGEPSEKTPEPAAEPESTGRPAAEPAEETPAMAGQGAGGKPAV